MWAKRFTLPINVVQLDQSLPLSFSFVFHPLVLFHLLIPKQHGGMSSLETDTTNNSHQLFQRYSICQRTCTYFTFRK